MIEFILFVTLVALMPNKLQYIHSPPEIFILSFSLRFFTFKCCKKMRTWKVKNAADLPAFFQPEISS